MEMVLEMERKPAAQAAAPVAVSEAARDERTAIEIDLRRTPFTDHFAPVLRAGSHMRETESLRVRVETVCWPLMGALNMYGLTYRILPRDGGAEIVVSRKLTEDQRRDYLDAALRPRYPGENQLHRAPPPIRRAEVATGQDAGNGVGRGARADEEE